MIIYLIKFEIKHYFLIEIPMLGFIVMTKFVCFSNGYNGQVITFYLPETYKGYLIELNSTIIIYKLAIFVTSCFILQLYKINWLIDAVKISSWLVLMGFTVSSNLSFSVDPALKLP